MYANQKLKIGFQSKRHRPSAGTAMMSTGGRTTSSSGPTDAPRSRHRPPPLTFSGVTELVTGQGAGAAPERSGIVVAGAQTLVCGHRGASRSLPDNSVAAFEAAIASGCDLIESDVRTDRRGRLVLAHDRVRLAAAGAPDRERPRRRASVRRAGRSPRIVPDPVALQTLLELASGRIGLDLEIKEARAVPALLDAIADWSGPLVLTSFDPAPLLAVRDHHPSRRTGLIAGPMHIGDPLADAAACGADLLVLSERRATAKLLATRRLPIWVWTVNQRTRLARWLAEPAVACVITDDPATAMSVRDQLPG
jgi:glycerophosphoryl diester phosphodiesterase